MFGIKTLSISALLAAALFAGAADVKLPMKMTDLAARLRHNCPGHVKISTRQDELVISISEAERKGGFDKTYGLNLKRFAGKKITIMIDVKLGEIDHGGKVPSTVGRLFFGDSVQNLVSSRTDWYTYTFKSVKIPNNGLLKMRISLKNLSGEIRLRNPHAKADLPKPSKKKKKKKN